MCTFCGREHNNRPKTKTIRVYGKNNQYITQKEVPIDTSVREVNRMLSFEYGFDWEYHTGCR